MPKKLSYSTPPLVEAAAIAPKTRRTGKRAALLSIALTAACVAGVINSATAAAEDTSMLSVAIKLVNGGSGTVSVLQENPRGRIQVCNAQQCDYGAPKGARFLVTTDAGLGTDTDYSGACAGTQMPPCSVPMDQDQLVIITFTGEG